MEGLNDAGVKNVFQHLARKITEVSFALYAQVISQTVPRFDYYPKYLRDCVIQMKLSTLLAYCFRQTSAALPRGAKGLSAVCDCGIS